MSKASKEKIVGVLRRHVEVFNIWRGIYCTGAVDLHDADLHDADLHDADLHDADLHDADLHDADLHDADLHGADLRGADLCGADLRGIDLRGADLRGADIYFSGLPLWYGGLDFKIDERIAKQLLYHVLNLVLPVVPELVNDELIDYANGFRRVVFGDLKKLSKNRWTK